MRIHLLAIGQRMPAWVQTGYQEYAQRLPAECGLQLHEFPLEKRGKNPDLKRLLRREGERMLAKVPAGALIIALDVQGQGWSTAVLADKLQDWQQAGRDVALLVGGPDGLAPDCLDASAQRWSLSPLTLPHPLVRILVAEQLYRAHTILSHHPYHRA